MAYLYDSPERPLPSSSSPASIMAMSLCTTQARDQDFAQGLYNYSGTFTSFSSDSYGNIMTDSLHVQDGWLGNMVKDSAAERRFTREIEVGSDGRCAPAGGEERHGGGMNYGNRRIPSENTSLMKQDWVVAGSSRDALLSSPLPTGTGSDLSSVWESDASNFNSQESREMVTPGNESSDDDGGTLDETDDRNPPFDPARLESMWTGPTPCYLGGCRPGRLYQTSQSWYSHVKNVHKKAKFCSEPGCPHTRPFANNTDLKRHIVTKHKDKKPFKCERSRCTRKVKAWPRKDKLKLHNSKYHSNYKCFFCSQTPGHECWFDTESEIWSHTNAGHANG